MHGARRSDTSHRNPEPELRSHRRPRPQRSPLRTGLNFAALLAMVGAHIVLAPPVLAAVPASDNPSSVVAAPDADFCAVAANGSTDYASIGAALANVDCTTISVTAGTYLEHVNIDRAVTIDGAGAETTIIDGGGSGGAVVRNSANGVVIGGVTITGGAGGDAGGIHSTGDLTVQESVIVDNQGGMAGAILSMFGSGNLPMLTVIDTLITENWGPVVLSPSGCPGNQDFVTGGIMSTGRGFHLQGTTMVRNRGGGFASAIFFEHEMAGPSLIEGSTLSDNRQGCGGRAFSHVTAGTAGGLTIRDSLIEGELVDPTSSFPRGQAAEISGPLLIENSTLRELDVALSAFVPTTVRSSLFENNNRDVDVENAAMTIEDTHFEGSRRGIFYDGPSLTMRNSTMTRQSWTTSIPPHPLAIQVAGDILLENNTITNNNRRGVELVSGTLQLVNNTITGNGAAGVAREAGTVTLRNNVVADNGTDCVGGVTDDHYNLDTDGTCTSLPTSLTVDDPLLGPLQDNGGLTPTRLPLAGSPVIDAADSVGCPATDQRGVTRPRDGGGDRETPCDIGSVELDGAARPVAHDQVVSTTTETALPIQLVTTDADGDPLTYTRTEPTSGTLDCDAAVSCTYTPDAGFTGTDSFTFAANDGANDSNTATVTIAVATAIASNADVIFVPGATGSPSGVDMADPYPSAIEVDGLTGPVTDLGLILDDFTHPFPADVDVLLVGPDGSNAVLMSDIGGSGGVSDIDLLLDDEAAEPLPTLSGLMLGAYQPTNNGDGDTFPAPAPNPSGEVALSTFDDIDPNGTWNLYVVDDGVGAIGDIGGWSLAITTDGPASTAPVAEGQAVSTPEDTSVAIQLVATDADGDPLTYAVVTQPASGTLDCDAAGACTYTPGDGFTGSDSFTFVANDGTDTSAPATVSITVNSGGLNTGDAVMSNGARTRSSGTLTCDAGNVFVLEMVLTQDGGGSAEGRARGTCTGEEQRYDVILATLPGSTLVAGTGELCATLRSAEPGARMAAEFEDSCHDVDVYLGSRSGI